MTAMMLCFVLGLFVGGSVSLIGYCLIAAGHCHTCEQRRDRWERIHWFAA